jgi:hypothetical protein
MRALVVARTRMPGDRVCVGAIEFDTGRSLRLKRPDGSNAFETHPIRPGTIWDLSYEPDPSVTPPHIEDVIVRGGYLVEDVADMRTTILDRWQPWDCDLDDIFEGQLHVTEHGTAFLRHGPRIPQCSTGFWLSRQPAMVDPWGNYRFGGEGRIRRVTYKGMTPAAQTIPVGALVRFSLARWKRFPPGVDEERCYLQLSGWYR